MLEWKSLFTPHLAVIDEQRGLTSIEVGTFYHGHYQQMIVDPFNALGPSLKLATLILLERILGDR